MRPDRSSIPRRLAELARRRPAIFGALGHALALNPVASEADLARFEEEHAVVLPDDYRWFLASVGNGGAGPYYGLNPLGMMDGMRGEPEPWSGDVVGELARPFPHSEAWNDLTGLPDESGIEEDEERYEAELNRFEERYWGAERIEGALPICHLGCALRILLVVTGPERGRVWLDKRADYEGLSPLASADGGRLTFLEWYDEWLTAALLEPPGR